MINIFLFFASFILYGQINTCQICLIDSTCDTDSIHFNISISTDCQSPFDTYFSYDTDTESEKHYLNKTINCSNCDIDLTVDVIHDAWDYTLTLVSPISIKLCPVVRTAHCGGYTSKYVWIFTGGLSGLFALMGVLLCSIRYCRTQRQMKKKTIIVQAEINKA